MRRTPSLLFSSFRQLYSQTAIANNKPPIIQITNATLYRQHPAALTSPGYDTSKNPPLFPNTSFSLPSFSSPPQHWCILGPSSSGKTTFLQILRGQNLCFPPNARSYPYLASDEIATKDNRLRYPGNAIQYVGFDGERGGLGAAGGTRGAYISARYESRRENTDFLLLDYLKGNTELNPAEDVEERVDQALLERVVRDLRLESLVDMPVGNLSNGQTRRSRIAKALMGRPEVLLLDEPFMGLDPQTLVMLSPLLHRLAEANEPRLVLALRPQDPLPDWTTHLIYIGQDCRIAAQGEKDAVIRRLREGNGSIQANLHAPDLSTTIDCGENMRGGLPDPGPIDMARVHSVARRKEEKTGGDPSRLSHDNLEEASHTVRTPDIAKLKKRGEAKAPKISRDGFNYVERKSRKAIHGEPLVQMEGVKIKYGDRTVLGDWTQDVEGQQREGLWWTVIQGQRWGIFGPNGSGKTTLLSLITSDHPQTYSAPIRLFQRSRLPSPGVPGMSLFDIQSRIGHSSPEVHAFFPRNLSVRRALESAWADAPLSKPRLTHEIDIKVDACLRWFQAELNPTLGPTTQQKEEMEREKIAPTKPRGAILYEFRKRFKDELNDVDALDWADDVTFGELPFSAQRVALFARALIREPDLVILDEAFSGMDDALRDKCLLYLSHGEGKKYSYFDESGKPLEQKRIVESELGIAKMFTFEGLKQKQALLVVSHVKEEVPGSVREWMCLPEPGMGTVRFGRLKGPLEGREEGWAEIWGLALGKEEKRPVSRKAGAGRGRKKQDADKRETRLVNSPAEAEV